jgi:hypothetical protein
MISFTQSRTNCLTKHTLLASNDLFGNVPQRRTYTRECLSRFPSPIRVIASQSNYCRKASL